MSDRSPLKQLNLCCRVVDVVFKWSFLSLSFMKTAYLVAKWYQRRVILKLKSGSQKIYLPSSSRYKVVIKRIIITMSIKTRTNQL